MSLALTPQQLLPGVDKVPEETAALLVTNPRFIEAYMVGLNDEIRRELAWRQYPVELDRHVLRQLLEHDTGHPANRELARHQPPRC